MSFLLKLVAVMFLAAALYPARAWDDVAPIQSLQSPVDAGSYTADVILVTQDKIHTGVDSFGIVLRITGGPFDARLVYDWFPRGRPGRERMKMIAADLGRTIPDDMSVWDAYQWFDGRTFVVTVRDFDTVHFQQCSRVDFRGYANP